MPFVHVPTAPHSTTRTHKRSGLGLPLPAILGLLITFAVAPTSVWSQQPVEVGDRVRVRLADRPNPLEGIFQGVEEGRLELAVEGAEEPFTLTLASVTGIDVHRGQKSHVLRGSAIGLLVGGLVGAGIVGNDEDCTLEFNARFCAEVGAGLGAGVGLLVGALVGNIVRTDRWEETPLDALRVSPIALRTSRLRLGVSIPIGGGANRRGGR